VKNIIILIFIAVIFPLPSLFASETAGGNTHNQDLSEGERTSREKSPSPGRPTNDIAVEGGELSCNACHQHTDYTHEDALRIGERMYREGILPSGEPMKAYVMEDIPVEGSMFSCSACHQHSGLGSVEGTVVTWPTNGRELYLPRYRTGAYKVPETKEEQQKQYRPIPKYYEIEPARPAYTDKSLAKALALGEDPTGRTIDPIMPRYSMNDHDMAILIYYLKHLNDEFSPGVDDTTLHFATVITEGVEQEKADDMLAVLNAYVKARNSLTRHQLRRADFGPFYTSQKSKAYRKVNLQVWKLSGPEETWREQLETYYAKNPVFALVGGIASGSWQKIHEFSENYKLPCIFPITDLPVISEEDWYTLYFSKGYYQEGDSTARYIRDQMKQDALLEDVKVVQIFQQNNPRSQAAARGFSTTWTSLMQRDVLQLVIKEEQLTDEQLQKILDEDAIILAWVDDTRLFTQIEQAGIRPRILFVSSSLLGQALFTLPEQLRNTLLVTHRQAFEENKQKSRFVVQRWLETNDIPLGHFDIQAKMYFLNWMLPGAVKRMQSYFYRDYFIEGFDMMIDQDYAIAVYPRLSFGPGQRYVSKGCYIARLKQGEKKLLPVSDWVIH